MNPLLNDYYNREKNAMALYDDTVKAAQGNAAMGANPLAPKLTATPGGIMSLSGVMPAGPSTLPWSGDTSQIPFGGFRARGGPISPGQAYIVGERGPEMIVPAAPGMVLPNGGSRIAQSPMNASYAPGSIASRPVRQIGRSMNDPARATEMAARYLRSQGDRAGAVRMLQNGALLNARINDQPDMPRAPLMTPMPAMTEPAQGRLVPGRSAGSMVWQQDQPTMPPTLDATSGQPVRSQPVPMGASPTQPSQPPAEQPVNPFEMTPLGGYVDPQFGMVPNGFKAMNERLALDPAGFPGLPMPPPGLYGPEAPPPVDVARLPGTDYVAPIFNGKVSPQTLQMTRPETPLPPGMVPTEATRGGVTYKAPGPETPKIPEGIQYEKDDMRKIIGGVYPTYNPQGKLVLRRIDLDGDGVVSPQEQAAAAQAAGKTPLGNSFSRVQ